MTGYLRLLAKNTAPGLTEPERKMIDEANKSCGRLLHIAQELSELAELSGEDPVRTWLPVPIFTLCGEVVQTAADAGGAVSFSMDDRDKAACVEGHAGRLRQALGLLISVIGRERGTTAMTVTGAISRTSESRAVLVFGEPADAADLNAVVGGQRRGVRSLARRDGLIAADRLPHHRSASRRALGAAGRFSRRLRVGSPACRLRLGCSRGPEGPRRLHLCARPPRLLQDPAWRLVRARRAAQADSTGRIAPHELVTAETAKEPSKGSSNPGHSRLR